MPDVRHRKSKPVAMPAFIMLAEALLRNQTPSATMLTTAATCQNTSRTRLSLRKPATSPTVGDGARLIGRAA